MCTKGLLEANPVRLNRTSIICCQINLALYQLLCVGKQKRGKRKEEEEEGCEPKVFL